LKLLLPYTLVCIQVLFLFFYYDDITADRDAYLNYAINANEIFNNILNYNFYNVFINEPLWILINIVLSFIINVEYVPLSVGLISYLLCANFVFKKVETKYILAIIILFFMPQIYKSFLVHLRQGLAVGIYATSFICCKKTNKYVLMTSAGLVHNSFIPITLFHIFCDRFSKYFSPKAIITITLLLGSTIGIFLLEILQLLNFRQHNNYFDVVQNNSGLGFFFWSLLFFILLTSNRVTLKKNLISIIPIGLYLLLYFINPLSARLLESYLIFIVSTIYLLPKYKFYTIYGMLLFWTILNNFTVNY
jgi:hypothetical protein